MAAIFDFQHTQTSDSIQICLSVLPDHDNLDIAVEISLLSCLQTEIYDIVHMYFRLMAAIFDLRHTETSKSIPTCLSVLPDPENMGSRGNLVAIERR